MNAVPFDTLKLARGLEAAGLASPVAAGTASALAEAMTSTDFATKSDLALLGFRLMGAIGAVETKVELLDKRADAQVGALETKVDGGMHALDNKIDTRVDALDQKIDTRADALNQKIDARADAIEARFDSRIELLRRDMTIKLGSMMLIAVGVILTAIRFMPHP